MAKKIEVSEDRLNSLIHNIKTEIDKQKGLFVLGTFNQRIPVLLKAESRKVVLDLFLANLLGESTKYSIHFEDPNGHWEIAVKNVVLFTFNLPDELKKQLASKNASGKYLDLKQGYLSTLNLSTKFNNTSLSLNLTLDNDWLTKARDLL